MSSPYSGSRRDIDPRRRPVSQLLRVQNFTVSSDGFGAGEDQSLERPFGHADPSELMAWAIATASCPTAPTRRQAGPRRLLHPRLRHNIGAEIMGRNKFGPSAARGRTTSGRAGGATSRRSTRRCSCMTHHLRPSFTLVGHHVPLRRRRPGHGARAGARRRPQGKDVRLGGGATTIREFLDADLVDTLHVGGRAGEARAGARLWESPDELLDRFHLEVVPSPSGVTHHLFWRK